MLLFIKIVCHSSKLTVEPHHCLLDDGVFIICATFFVMQYVSYIITIASCFALTQEIASIYGCLFPHNTVTKHFIFVSLFTVGQER